MEVHLTPDQEATLQQLAATEGRGPGDLARELLGAYLEHQARIRSAVQRSIEQLDRSEGIPHEDLVARIEKRFGA